ncbi:hypothetical protein LTR66_015204, partial [Elasticomyces elasticus]
MATNPPHIDFAGADQADLDRTPRASLASSGNNFSSGNNKSIINLTPTTPLLFQPAPATQRGRCSPQNTYNSTHRLRPHPPRDWHRTPQDCFRPLPSLSTIVPTWQTGQQNPASYHPKRTAEADPTQSHPQSQSPQKVPKPASGIRRVFSTKERSLGLWGQSRKSQDQCGSMPSVDDQQQKHIVATDGLGHIGGTWKTEKGKFIPWKWKDEFPKGNQRAQSGRNDTPAPMANSSAAAQVHVSRPRYHSSVAPDVIPGVDYVQPATCSPVEIERARIPPGGAAARLAASISNSGGWSEHFGFIAAAGPHSSRSSPVAGQASGVSPRSGSYGSNPGFADSANSLSGTPASSEDVKMTDATPPTHVARAGPVVVYPDPVKRLPAELIDEILSYLDARGLAQCRGVNKIWADFANKSYVWRELFLNNFDPARKPNAPSEHTSPYIQVGGLGIGAPAKSQPNQPWQRMYEARARIERNWAHGTAKAKANYLVGHTDSVYCLQFDEHKIITGSRDRTIRVWQLEHPFKCVKVIGGPGVIPGPGPRVLRTVDYPHYRHTSNSVNGTAHGRSIYHQPNMWHDASILCLQYDDKIMVTGSSDMSLLVWDIETFQPFKRLERHQGGVLDVAFDSRFIVSCSKDSTIIVWDRNTLEPIHVLTGHRGPVNAVQLRGDLLVSASGDG